MPHADPINPHFHSCHLIVSRHIFSLPGWTDLQQIVISYGILINAPLQHVVYLYSVLIIPELQTSTSTVYCTAFFLYQGSPTRSTKWDLFAFVEVEGELRFPKSRKRYHWSFAFRYAYSLRGLDCFCPDYRMRNSASLPPCPSFLVNPLFCFVQKWGRPALSTMYGIPRYSVRFRDRYETLVCLKTGFSDVS